MTVHYRSPPAEILLVASPALWRRVLATLVCLTPWTICRRWMVRWKLHESPRVRRLMGGEWTEFLAPGSYSVKLWGRDSNVSEFTMGVTGGESHGPEAKPLSMRLRYDTYGLALLPGMIMTAAEVVMRPHFWVDVSVIAAQLALAFAHGRSSWIIHEEEMRAQREERSRW